MACYWYDPEYKLSTCTCTIGDALKTCDCDGDVDRCSLREFGRPVAVETETQYEHFVELYGDD